MKYDYVIVGLGNTGLSCAKHLARLNLSFAITDSRDSPPGLDELKSLLPNTQVSLGQFDQALMLAAKELVVSQGVSYQQPTLLHCQSAGIPLIGDLELFARYVQAPVIAITGSNGKSTVTTLVGEMLAAAGKSVKVGGNLGIPALDLIASVEPDFYVLEVSNFQLEMTYSLQAEVACILNISPDHLDRYASYNDYILAKQRVYLGCKKAVINRDDKLTALPLSNPAQVISFGSDIPAVNQFGLLTNETGQTYLACGDEKLLDVNLLRIKGRHNWLNALSALAIAAQVSAPLAPLLSVLGIFPGLPHRCQWVREINGVDWYNDSKGTNIVATLAAIEGLGSVINGKLVLLAGGLGKGADFTELKPAVLKFVRHMILFGQDAPLIAKAMDGDVLMTFAADINEAINQAAQLSIQGDAVLLSPACASWDMFKNFEHRGQVFCELVRGL